MTSFQTVVFCFVPAVMAIRGLRRIATSTGYVLDRAYLLIIVSVVVAQPLLHLANVASIRDAWPYLTAAVAALVVPFILFLRLLGGVLRSGDAA